MTLRAATITEQGQTFMVVDVPKPVLEDQRKAEQAVQFFQSRFAPLPTVLVTSDAFGMPTAYFGRRDLAPLLLRVSRMPWQEVALT
jgi:hypothetical protein